MFLRNYWYVAAKHDEIGRKPFRRVIMNEPVVFYRSTPAGQVPSYPENETPTLIKGWVYAKAKITSTGGYEEPNQPYLDFNAYAAGGGKSRDFAFDGHTSAHVIRSGNVKALAPSTSWGHFHENMVEAWVVLEGQLDVLITGEPLELLLFVSGRDEVRLTFSGDDDAVAAVRENRGGL